MALDLDLIEDQNYNKGYRKGFEKGVEFVVLKLIEAKLTPTKIAKMLDVSIEDIHNCIEKKGFLYGKIIVIFD